MLLLGKIKILEHKSQDWLNSDQEIQKSDLILTSMPRLGRNRGIPRTQAQPKVCNISYPFLITQRLNNFCNILFWHWSEPTIVSDKMIFWFKYIAKYKFFGTCVFWFTWYVILGVCAQYNPHFEFSLTCSSPLKAHCRCSCPNVGRHIFLPSRWKII